MNKKVIGFLTITICLSAFIFADIQPSKKQHNLGRDRVFTIMYDGDHGINSYNKNITYAETQNLVEDIAIPQIALYFDAKTDLGQTFLVDTLSLPISPKDTNNTVQLRKNVIKNLVEHATLQQEINDLLIQAKDTEAVVMELMTNRNAALEKLKIPEDAWEIMKPWYIMKKNIGQNPWWNLASQGGQVLQTAALGATTGWQAQKAYETLNSPGFTLEDPKLQQNLSNYSSRAFVAGNITLSSALSLRTDYQDGVKNRNLIHALHIFIIIAEKIEALCKKHGIQTQFTISSIKDPKGIAMIQGLKHSRYQDKEAMIVLTAWVNTFINEIYEQDIYLAPIFALIAEMDAYNAIAIKMIATKDNLNKFCFAHILSQQKPKFESLGFWNTVVTNPTANSLAEDRNIILTGPNAGGKSTAIRSILQNIILSQTFCIATGKSFALTPYDVIHSYLKITDDISKGLSRYASELKQASDIVIRAKTLRHDEKFFFVLDELFTGTGGKDGEICAYEFVNDDLAPFSNQIQFIFATHFDTLKEIGTNNPAMFANYKIDAPIVNTQGKLQYPFTLSAGINNINIAQQMKREAGLLGNASKQTGKHQAA